MTRAGHVTVLMITHKLREVMAFADEVAVLRRGKLVGKGSTAALTPAVLAQLMVGAREIPQSHAKKTPAPSNGGAPPLAVRDLRVEDDAGRLAVDRLSLTIAAGEIVGIAGVSGNGQRELVEALIGQRPRAGGEILVGGEPFHATRDEIRRHRVFSLPEEPLRNACVPAMSVAENMTLRNFDRPPQSAGPWLRRGALRAQAERWISAFGVKTEGPDAPMATLSGGNVQRAVLARELSEPVSVLIAANPVFGLDFAAVAEIHARILQVRAKGGAVLLISEDLDEILALADRVVVMYEGELTGEFDPRTATIEEIGLAMAGGAER
jgi:simple sugar transport system ATP-binding protein